MDAEQKLELITKNLQEFTSKDRLLSILKERDLKLYWGTATTGRPHIAYFVPLTHISNFLAAGCHVKILFADLHAYLDDQKAPWELLDHRVAYYEAVIKAMLKSIGVPIEKLEFVRGSTYQLTREFTLDMFRMASLTTLHDAQRAGAEVVRQSAQAGTAKLSGLIYPGLQCLDEQYLGVDAQFGGADQRKIFMYSKKLLPQLGYPERIHLMNRMIPGLTGDKMSSSEADSKIDMLDSAKSVKGKIGKAFCELGNVEQNPPLSFLRYVVFPLHELKGVDGFHIARPDKWGGPIHYTNYDDVHSDFESSKLSPEDLKIGLIDAVNALLDPVRAEFDNDEMRALIARAYPEPAKGDKKKGKKGGGGAPAKPMDVSRIELRVGRVVSVGRLEGSDKLYHCKVDVGDEAGPRDVLSGLVGHVDAADIDGKNVAVVCNLPPREVSGVKSSAVALAASTGEGETLKIELVEAPDACAPGTRISVEGFPDDAFDDELPEKRKRVFHKVSQEFEIAGDNGLTATYRGIPWTTPEGPVGVKTLTGAAIR